MNTSVKVSYQCDHCGQHYLRKESWLKHETNCARKKFKDYKCFQCAFMEEGSQQVLNGDNLSETKTHFCDKLGYNLEKPKKEFKSDYSTLIPMPKDCPCFKVVI